ncbi:MAG TPA: type II secretion system F family protein [Alphaproteobacteria bacterium]
MMWLDHLSISMQFDARVRERFYRKLAQLLRNGIPIDRSLEQMAMTEGKQKRKGLAKLIKRWRHSIENGVNFGTCIAPYVPSNESLLLESGGNYGKMQRALTEAADAVAQQRRVKKMVIRSSSYPALLLTILGLALFLASHQVIPAFAEVLPVEKWTGAPLLVAKVSNFIRHYGGWLLLTIFALGVLVAFSMPYWRGPSRMIVERMVPWSVYRMWQGSSFLLSIASLMSSGVKIDEVALKRVASRVSPYMQERIEAISRQTISGHNLGEAMYRAGYGFPDVELIDDMRIYAALRNFEDNITTIAREWVDDVLDRIDVAMKIANTVVLVLIAVTMGMLIVSIFSVVQQIQESANQV